MKIIVYHSEYGCESGCCGHVIEVTEGEDPRPLEKRVRFHFEHPYGVEAREFAEKLVREEFGQEHIADLDWDNCVISDS